MHPRFLPFTNLSRDPVDYRISDPTFRPLSTLCSPYSYKITYLAVRGALVHRDDDRTSRVSYERHIVARMLCDRSLRSRLGKKGVSRRSCVIGVFYAQIAPKTSILVRMEPGAGSRTQTKACATLILLVCCPCAFALNPAFDINQYAHTAWTIREGFFRGTISSIAQTPDGYLWLGTEFGLLRFDGVRSVPWQPPKGERLPSSFVRSLLAARDGRLWIGTAEGLASWKDGKLSHYPELAGQTVVSLLEDRKGTVWAGGSVTSNGRLCAISRGSVECSGEDGSFGSGVTSLYEDSTGNLFAGAVTGLWRWKPGPPKLYPTPDTQLSALIEGDNDALLISTRSGIRRLADGKADAYQLPRPVGKYTPVRMLRDRDGSLWIGTSGQGLLHVHQGRADLSTQSDGLSGDVIENLFEDREGNIWVATLDGLDRFRDFAIPTISAKQGLSIAAIGSVLAARDGGVWLGTRDGLNLWNNGQTTIYRKRNGLPDDVVESLYQDARGRIWVSTNGGVAHLENGRPVPLSGVPGRFVLTIAGDGAGNLWFSHQSQGLFRLLEGNAVEQIPWARLGLGRKDWALSVLPDSLRGGLWLGFRLGGVAYLKDGQVRESYASRDGLGEGRVEGLQLDQDGALWAAAEGGLSRIKNGRVTTLTSKNGLPCDAVHWVVEDDDQSFWLYMTCGLVRIARPELESWATDPKRTIRLAVFDSSDGVRSRAISSGYNPGVSKSADGKLWFLPRGGVSVIDPRHLPFNKLSPPVHIEQITADRKTYQTSSSLRLPPLVRDLEIDYTALSLVAPEKIRFRVRLEGRDPDWKDVGNERKALYNDLPPRSYRFRVMASNNSGVWNEAGASFDFSIAPAYYQTRWFQTSCVAAFLALLWALHRFRLHQIAQQFNAQLEARVGERTRIARELHDTLLQSFQGLLLRFQVVDESLPPGRAKEELERALDLAARAITEGRDTVQGLRSSTVQTNDFALAIRALGEELAGDERDDTHPNSVECSVEVEGTPRDLRPILRDEVYRIVGEALRNAFRHAQARRIEVAIGYGERQFRLRVRDDGKGIDPDVLDGQARAGHFGLPGMRERAELIGADMEVWSQSQSGTEVELKIRAAIAYAGSSAGRRSRLLRMPFAKKTGTNS
jgi:signal transduction histidine kinase/ligand-binding sensor domain-containing protein